jgi:acyl-coenzyme A thioesterase PaaI-like protein
MTAFRTRRPDCSILTVEYKLNIDAPGDGTLLIARGSVLKPGRTLVVARADAFILKDGQERFCATALETLLLPDKPHEPAWAGGAIHP